MINVLAKGGQRQVSAYTINFTRYTLHDNQFTV